MAKKKARPSTARPRAHAGAALLPAPRVPALVTRAAFGAALAVLGCSPGQDSHNPPPMIPPTEPRPEQREPEPPPAATATATASIGTSPTPEPTASSVSTASSASTASTASTTDAGTKPPPALTAKPKPPMVRQPPHPPPMVQPKVNGGF